MKTKNKKQKTRIQKEQMRKELKEIYRKMLQATALIIAITILSNTCYGLGMGTMAKEIVYTPNQITSINYYIVKNPGERVTATLEFNGTLKDYIRFDIPHYWYSTKGDKLNYYLEREFNLSTTTNATLTFYTKYNIEHGWDFGYVEVSTDNGTTWHQLSGTGTTTYRDPSAYVGVSGAPAYTGSVANWTFETMDLTPYAGNNIKLRFRYVTDDAWSEHGWLIDDIAIPEIGFFDDVENGEDGWETNGWVSNSIDDTSNNQLIPLKIDFQIPDSFTWDGSDEIITITRMPWDDNGFNPSTVSTEKIRVKLPKLVKYVPPTHPSGGGGGGGGTGHPYYIYSGNTVTFYAPAISHYSTTEIKPGRNLESAIIDISLKLVRNLRNVRVSLTKLPGRPTDVYDPLAEVYQYFQITKNIECNSVDSAIITFFVTSQWMEENNASTEDIVMMRWNQGNWQELMTNYVGMEGSNYLFEAETPCFSTFAIMKRKKEIEKPIIQAEPTERGDKLDTERVLFISGKNFTLEDFKKIILMKTYDETKLTEEQLKEMDTLPITEYKPETEAKEKEEPDKEEKPYDALKKTAVQTITETLGLKNKEQKQEMKKETKKETEKKKEFPIKDILLTSGITALLIIAGIIIIARKPNTENKKENKKDRKKKEKKK